MSPPKETKRVQERASKLADQNLNKAINQFSFGDDVGSGSSQAATSFFFGTPDELPISDQYEEIEQEECAEIARLHRIKVANAVYFNQNIPIQVHISVPEIGRVTHEVETTLNDIRTIETVVDLAKGSLAFEIRSARIDTERTVFAGLMIYGPTDNFARVAVFPHTRGLFLADGAYKKWWLEVAKSSNDDKVMIKIGVVLWDRLVAEQKGLKLPPFWNQAKDSLRGKGLEKPEWNITLKDLQIGCRSYLKMQEQVQEARIAASHTTFVKIREENAALKREIATLKNQIVALTTEEDSEVVESEGDAVMSEDVEDTNDDDDDDSDYVDGN